MTRPLSLERTFYLLLLAAVAAVLVDLVARPAAAVGAVPYDDPATVGYLGLCDKAGQPVDHGDIHDRPFVWSALASAAAPAGYDAEGRTATLFAYQPRPG